MRVLIACEAHFWRWEGGVWTTAPEDYGFWSSYGEQFDEVGVLARVRPGEPPAGARRADGPGVRFHQLADYKGPAQFFVLLPLLKHQAARAADMYQCYLLRAPGAVAYLAGGAVRRLGRRYGVEVLGDPWESLGAGFRRWSRGRLRALCRDAAAVCYVTAALERRYPSRGRCVWVASDVRLSRVATEACLRVRQARAFEAAAGRREWRLGFLGSLERPYKAPEVHLEAIARCRQGGLNVTLWVAGDGRLRPRLERRAARLGLGAAARFLGALPAGEAVERFLDATDLFTLASRTEGLPRALVEAMARGCPAIGSAVGGIPELLDEGSLVEPGSAGSLAARITEFLGSPKRLAAMGWRNRQVAEQYLWERLAPRRREFLWALADCCT